MFWNFLFLVHIFMDCAYPAEHSTYFFLYRTDFFNGTFYSKSWDNALASTTTGPVLEQQTCQEEYLLDRLKFIYHGMLTFIFEKYKQENRESIVKDLVPMALL